MKNVDLHNSHYLNEKNRLFPHDKQRPWQDRDADYNIRSGVTFGVSEEETIEKQHWNGGSSL